MSLTAPHPSFPAGSVPALRHRSSRSLVTAAAAVAAIAAGGYVAATVTSGAGASAASPAARALGNQVLATSSLPGLVTSRAPVVVHGAGAWTQTAGSVAQPVARLRSLGFTGGVIGRLQTSGPGGARWISLAERFRTPGGARTEARYLVARLQSTSGATVTGFAVTGVPGAQGLRIAGPRTAQVAAVFAAGNYVYMVRAGGPATPAQVSAAGGWLYLALYGCVAPSHHGRTEAPPVRS